MTAVANDRRLAVDRFIGNHIRRFGRAMIQPHSPTQTVSNRELGLLDSTLSC